MITSFPSRSRAGRVLIASSGLAAVVLATSAAHAGDAAAEALFQEGKRLSTANQWTQACPKFEESYKLEPKMGTQFHLAQCFEKIGKTASAWENYLEVAGKAKADGNKDKETYARDQARALEPRLVRLKINVIDRSPGLVVKRNHVPIGSAQWGLAIPVDPGRISVSAVAPGRTPWSELVDARAEGQIVVTVVPRLDPGAGGVVYPGGPGPGPGPVIGGYPPPPPPMRYERRSPALWAVGGVLTTVGLLTGVFAGLGALALANDNKPADAEVAGWVALGGLGVMVVGIPLVVIGSQRIPVGPEPQNGPPPPVAKPFPEIRVGAGSVQATWHF